MRCTRTHEEMGQLVTGPVDTSPVVTADTFRACLEEVAADDGVDAVLAVAVPTAYSDLSAAVAVAELSKPLAAAFLDRAESVQRLERLPVTQPAAGQPADTSPTGGPGAAVIIDEAAAAVTGVPAYADPESAARALGHAARYRAWRGRQRGTIRELGGTAHGRGAHPGHRFPGRLAGRRLAAGSQRS